MPPFQRSFPVHPKNVPEGAFPGSTPSGVDTQDEPKILAPETALAIPPAFEQSPTPPHDADSHSPHNPPTYRHRGVQTSPQLYSHDTFAHPHPGPYYLTFGNTYPYLLPFQMPSAVAYPAIVPHGYGGVHNGTGQRWRRAANVSAPVMPPHPFPIYSRVPIPQHTFMVQHPTSPLIAPPPKVPLPPPESLAFVSEPSILATPSSPPYSTSTDTTSSGVITRRTPSTTPPHSSAPPIENPLHTLYKSLRSVLLISEPDPHFLAREINGEQLVSVHGVGVWSVRATSAAIEDAKQSAFQAHASRAAWLHAARARTAHYAIPGVVRPPLRWVLVEPGAALPADALQTGTEASGARLFSARGWWAGGLHLGKAAPHLRNGGASISYGSLEQPLTIYEVLVGDQQYAKWLDVPSGVVLSFPPMSSETLPVGALNAKAPSETCTSSSDAIALPTSFTPVEGGREAGGEALLIAQAAHSRGWHPGKARLGDDHCCVAYGGGELWVKKFRVLGYNI